MQSFQNRFSERICMCSTNELTNFVTTKFVFFYNSNDIIDANLCENWERTLIVADRQSILPQIRTSNNNLNIHSWMKLERYKTKLSLSILSQMELSVKQFIQYRHMYICTWCVNPKQKCLNCCVRTRNSFFIFLRLKNSGAHSIISNMTKNWTNFIKCTSFKWSQFEYNGR